MEIMSTSDYQELHNNWVKSDLSYGTCASVRRILRRAEIRTFEWEEACRVVDTVLKRLLEEFKIASEKYEGLHIYNRYIKQGSARKGLKVISPDEFDVILPYKIRHLHPRFTGLEIRPGLRKMEVEESMDTIQSRYPKFYECKIFEQNRKHVILNVKKLQKHVFSKILDKALNEISSSPNFKYSIKRRFEPPTMKLSIFKKGTEVKLLDIDVVPGMQFDVERICVPASVTGRIDFVKFPLYVVMKWVNREDPMINNSDKDYLWRISSTEMERYMTDISRGNKNRKYILTACMVLKTLFSEFRENQVAILYKSYYITNICMHLILTLTICEKVEILRVEEALVYYLELIKMSLRKRYLPSFFHGNNYLQYVFPQSYFTKEASKPLFDCKFYNIFKNDKSTLFHGASRAFRNITDRLQEAYHISGLDQKECKYKLRLVYSLFPAAK